ncbi:hypothetical protein BY996DRAFT_6580071 [Phakopsora pachyrhizi]|nr:hypothetical protein BY996DRAFT_6580071 [Phakopsora pachyrhizi]
MRLRNNLLLGSGISHQLSTDLISPTQSENTFSTSPIISTSFPFSKYHHQNNDEELTSSSPVLQSYRSIKHEPTHLNNPEWSYFLSKVYSIQIFSNLTCSFDPRWFARYIDLNQSLYSKESSSSHIGYQNLSLASSNPTNDKFAVELWKLYGPAYQELPPDNNSLESLKTEFLESFKPPENQKSKCTPFDSLNPVQETKKLFGVTQSSELERGRISAIEMSRPPETTMMNWRNSSLSRTRASDQTIRFTEGEGYNFLPSLLPPDSFNIKFESSSAKTCDKKWCEGISTRPMSLSPLPCQAILPQSLNGSPTNGEELISSGDTIPEKWPQNSQSPVYLLRSMQSCPKNSPTNTRDSSSSSYPVLSTNNGSNNHTDLFSGSRLSQNLSFLAPDNSLHSTSSASAGMMSDYDSIDFSMKPHFQNSMLGSIPGLNEDFAKLANAHAEYGSIPRVVRKTSFDETLAHQIQKSVALGSFCNAAMTEFINPLVMMNDPGQLGLLNLEQPSILTDGTRTNTLNGTMSYTGYHKKFVMEDGLQKSAGQNFHWNQADQSLSSSSNIQDTRSYEYINQSLNLNNSSKNLSRGEESRNLNLEMEYSPKTVLNTREVRGDDISVQVFRNEKNTRSAIGESAQSHHSNHAILCNDLNSSNEKLDSSELKSAKMFSSTNHGDILQDEKSQEEDKAAALPNIGIFF